MTSTSTLPAVTSIETEIQPGQYFHRSLLYTVHAQKSAPSSTSQNVSIGRCRYKPRITSRGDLVRRSERSRVPTESYLQPSPISWAQLPLRCHSQTYGSQLYIQLTAGLAASVSTFTERITIPYTSTLTQTLAPSTYTSTRFETLPPSTTTLVSSFVQPASTVYQSTTITSNFVTTLTSTIAPSTITSYQIRTAPGKLESSKRLVRYLTLATASTITSYSTIQGGPAGTVVITQTQAATTIVSTAYATTPVTSVSTYTQVRPKCGSWRRRRKTKTNPRLQAPSIRLPRLLRLILRHIQQPNIPPLCHEPRNIAPLQPLQAPSFKPLR